MSPVQPLRDRDVPTQGDREDIAHGLYLRDFPNGSWADEPQATRIAYRARAACLIREGFPDARAS